MKSRISWFHSWREFPGKGKDWGSSMPFAQVSAFLGSLFYYHHHHHHHRHLHFMFTSAVAQRPFLGSCCAVDKGSNISHIAENKRREAEPEHGIDVFCLPKYIWSLPEPLPPWHIAVPVMCPGEGSLPGKPPLNPPLMFCLFFPVEIGLCVALQQRLLWWGKHPAPPCPMQQALVNTSYRNYWASNHWTEFLLY